MLGNKTWYIISDVGPHWSYADPDQQNLVNADPGQKFTKFISNHLSKVKEKYFQICTLNLVISYFFLVLDLKNTISYKKKILVKLCFSLNFMPLDPDPDPRTQMNADPTGSGSTSLTETKINNFKTMASLHTVCPKSSNPFYIVTLTYCIKWVTISWTHRT